MFLRQGVLNIFILLCKFLMELDVMYLYVQVKKILYLAINNRNYQNSMEWNIVYSQCTRFSYCNLKYTVHSKCILRWKIGKLWQQQRFMNAHKVCPWEIAGCNFKVVNHEEVTWAMAASITSKELVSFLMNKYIILYIKVISHIFATLIHCSWF